MGEVLKNESEIRQYILGQLDDEATIDRIDELLFTDEDFAEQVIALEDSLIDDLVHGELSAAEAAALKSRASENISLQQRIAVSTALAERAVRPQVDAARPSLSFLDSISAFFKQPIIAGAFAVGIILIIAAVVFWRDPSSDEFADLRAIYKNERPTQARISDFDHAPLVTRRGAAEEREAARLRRIELALLERTEKEPTSKSYHELGRFYLTQQRFPDAISALERSISLDPKNVRALNELGSTYFERARTEDASARFKTLTLALDKFAAAIEISPQDTASLFNLAQTQQALELRTEAKASWQRYLELDSSTGWAEEARKALERLDQGGISKTESQAVDDTLAAVANGDAETAFSIQSQTREMAAELWVPRQLIRRFVDAKARGDDVEAARTIEALKFVGELERSRNADFFVSEIASHYQSTADISGSAAADSLLSEGYALLKSKKIEMAQAKFAESRDRFAAAGDRWMSMMADLWVAHALTDVSKLAESDEILTRLSNECKARKYVWLGIHVDDWKANNHLLRNEVGQSYAINQATLARAESIGDQALINRINNAISSKLESFGDLDRSLAYLGRVSVEVPYGNEGARRWRRNGNASDTLLKLGKPRVAEFFAKEALANALNGTLGRSQAVDDMLRDLITINVRKGDIPTALKFANDARERALSTADAALKAKLLRYTTISIADLQRTLGDHELALAGYDEAMALQAADREVQIDQYEANRGRTMVLLELGRNSEEQLAKTMQLSEQFRSRILDQGSRSAFLASERELAEAMIDGAIKNGEHQKALDLSESSRARSLLDNFEDDASIDQLEARYPTVSAVSTLSELQRSMPENVQVIEYAMLKNRLAIWHFTADQFNYAESPISEKQLSSEIDALLNSVVRTFAKDDEVRTSSNKLYASLISPIERFLDKRKQLVIIPDGTIGKLPFALLANANGRYLIEEHTLSYSPSANIFVRTTQTANARSTQAESLLAVGDPAFDRAEQPDLDALPSAAAEVRTVAALYPQASTFIGTDATKSKILDRLPAATTFHYAGHYVVNEGSPTNSRMVLAAGGDSPDLRLEELIKLRLNQSMLVVLSACDTNSENIVPGEGSTGIAQKFIAIGAPLVVAGNWKIDSDSTSELMQAFHKNRRTQKMTTADALRQAQLSAMRDRDGNPRPPYHWAAFAAIGGYTVY